MNGFVKPLSISIHVQIRASLEDGAETRKDFLSHIHKLPHQKGEKALEIGDVRYILMG